MHSRDNRTQNGGGGLLKTTTWGALIALSLLVTAWGFNGHWLDSKPTFTTVAQSEVKPNSPVATPEQASRPAEHAIAPAASKQSSVLGTLFGFSDGRNQAATSTVSASVRETVADSSANPAATATDSTHRHSDVAASAGPTEEPQVLMAAAKIAPDLKGIDPETAVDVIVQYRHAPAANELADDGAETKADFPSLKAQLVTVKGGNVANLATHSNVAYISPNRKIRGALDKVVTAINADIAFSSGWDGSGIGIAVLDSGVSNVNDLNSDGNY